MLAILLGFIFIVPAQVKNRTLNFLGINVKSYKHIVSSGLYRYSSIFLNPIYNQLLGEVWKDTPNPYDPDSGWESRISTRVKPLDGKNVEIVPSKSIGYKMDHTCNPSTWNGNAYSYTDISCLLKKDIMSANDRFSASVYCYVSEDFDGTWAGISAENAVPEQCYQFYDFDNKGVWQKLQIDFRPSNNTVPTVYLYWSKFGVKDFTSLKGYIIYAYPQYLKIDQKNNTFQINPSEDNDSEFHSAKTIYTNEANILASALEFLNQTYKDTDPIRNFSAKFISEDTIYYGYKNDLKIDTISNKFLEGRLMRWNFAIKIFTREYTWKQRLLGGGFSFLNWYGYYFFADKLKSDWPHNPFLSIVLYSGIIGLLSYILLIYIAFKYYIASLNEYFIYAIYFLITFFFSFFSGGSPFDPPIMGFFIMLPFLIHNTIKDNCKTVTHFKIR